MIKGEMPPWSADPRFGEFHNDPRLSAEQIRTLAAWADAGAPEGDTPLAVQPPKANDGWTHPFGRDPDLVIEMAHALRLSFPKNGAIGWSVHYTMIGKPFADKTKIGFWFQKNMTHEIVIGFGDDRNQIAAGREYVEGDGISPKRVPGVDEQPVWDASHSPECRGLAADGDHGVPERRDVVYPVAAHACPRTRIDLRVDVSGWPRTDSVEQPKIRLQLAALLHLARAVDDPGCSTIKTVESFDNSSRNKGNPAPNKEVYWSEQAWDEMFNGYRDMSFDKPNEADVKRKTRRPLADTLLTPIAAASRREESRNFTYNANAQGLATTGRVEGKTTRWQDADLPLRASQGSERRRVRALAPAEAGRGRRVHVN